MKPNLEIVPLYETKLLIKKEYLKFMNINWHIHPEYELVLISSNGGMEYIGSYSKPINGTELLLLGPNIPHMWYTNNNDPGLRQRLSDRHTVSPGHIQRDSIHHTAVRPHRHDASTSGTGSQFPVGKYRRNKPET